MQITRISAVIVSHFLSHALNTIENTQLIVRCTNINYTSHYTFIHESFKSFLQVGQMLLKKYSLIQQFNSNVYTFLFFGCIAAQ